MAVPVMPDDVDLVRLSAEKVLRDRAAECRLAGCCHAEYHVPNTRHQISSANVRQHNGTDR